MLRNVLARKALPARSVLLPFELKTMVAGSWFFRMAQNIREKMSFTLLFESVSM